MGEDRHAGIGLNAGDEALAAARHDDIDRPTQTGQQFADRGAVADGDHLDCVSRQAGAFQPLCQAGMDGAGGMERVRSAAQDDRIARFEAEGAGVGRDIGAAFIDHADDAQGRADALYPEPVGAIPFGNDVPDRVGQGGNGADAVRDASMRLSSSFSRSTKEAAMSLASAASTSSALASRISWRRAEIASAMALSAAFF
jgi:hypothetical protein